MMMFARSSRSVLSASRKNMSYVAMNQHFAHDATVNRAATTTSMATATLENGATIIAKDNNSPVASFQVAITQGSGAESIAQQGAASFLASAALAGNEISTGARIAKFFEDLGAKVSATSTPNKIVYNIVTLKDNAEPALTAFLSAISTAPYAPHVYDDFKSTAQAFQENKKECPIINLSQVLGEAAYGEASGFGRSSLVNYDNLSAKDILEFRANAFAANNLVVAGTGVSLDLIKETVESVAFPTTAATAPTPTYVGGYAKLRSGSDKAYVGVSYPTTGINTVAIDVLEQILANKIPGGVINSAKGKGLFGYYVAGATEETVSEKLTTAAKELKAIAAGNLSDEDLSKAANKVTVNNYEKLNNATTASGVLVDLVLSQSKEEALDARKIKKDEIVNIVKKLLKEPVSYGAYGATALAPAYGSVLKIVA